jgi:hypothetical protein
VDADALGAMRFTQLQELARAEGLPAADIEAALDADRPRDALAQLLAQHAGAGPAANAARGAAAAGDEVDEEGREYAVDLEAELQRQPPVEFSTAAAQLGGLAIPIPQYGLLLVYQLLTGRTVVAYSGGSAAAEQIAIGDELVALEVPQAAEAAGRKKRGRKREKKGRMRFPLTPEGGEVALRTALAAIRPHMGEGVRCRLRSVGGRFQMARVRSEAAAATLLGSLGECGIERRGSISVEEFERDYRGQKPVIMTAATDNAAFRARVTWDWLLETKGAQLARISSPVHKGVRPDVMDLRLPVRNYLLSMHRYNTSASPSFNYLFTYGKTFFTQEESADWQSHPVLPQGRIADDGVFFAVGQQGTGLPFHFHKEAWNEAVAGLKRWSVYPPSEVPPAHYLMIDSHAEWLQTVLPKLLPAERPAECLQRPGELVYVPEGWWHAVVNVEPTMAVIKNNVPTRFDPNSYGEQLAAARSVFDHHTNGFELSKLGMPGAEGRTLEEKLVLLDEAETHYAKALVALPGFPLTKWEQFKLQMYRYIIKGQLDPDAPSRAVRASQAAMDVAEEEVVDAYCGRDRFPTHFNGCAQGWKAVMKAESKGRPMWYT